MSGSTPSGSTKSSWKKGYKESIRPLSNDIVAAIREINPAMIGCAEQFHRIDSFKATDNNALKLVELLHRGDQQIRNTLCHRCFNNAEELYKTGYQCCVFIPGTLPIKSTTCDPSFIAKDPCASCTATDTTCELIRSNDIEVLKRVEKVKKLWDNLAKYPTKDETYMAMTRNFEDVAYKALNFSRSTKRKQTTKDKASAGNQGISAQVAFLVEENRRMAKELKDAKREIMMLTVQNEMKHEEFSSDLEPVNTQFFKAFPEFDQDDPDFDVDQTRITKTLLRMQAMIDKTPSERAEYFRRAMEITASMAKSRREEAKECKKRKQSEEGQEEPSEDRPVKKRVSEPEPSMDPKQKNQSPAHQKRSSS